MSPSAANLDHQGNQRRMVGMDLQRCVANLDHQGNQRRMVGMDLQRSAANLDHQGNQRRMVGMDLQRSEFEDFMNAYRPTLDVVNRREQKSAASSSSSEEPRADLGRSFKRLIKRTQTSPSIQHRNRKEGFQRTSETHDRERSVTNELKPPTVPSQEKKARRPYSMNLDGTTSPHDSRQRVEASPIRVTHEHNPGHSTKNGRPKAERSSTGREVEHHPQQHPKPKVVETPLKNGAKPPKIEKAPAARQEPQVQVKVSAETSAIPTIVQPPAPSPLNAKKKVSSAQDKVSFKEDGKKISTIEPKIVHSPEHLPFDCLAVAASMIDRYLPPKHNPDPLLSLRVIQIPERKYHVILEFQECPAYEKPKTSSSGLLVIEDDDDVICARDQKMAFEWLRESHVAVSGMLLNNVEKLTEFPFVTYLVVGGSKQDLCNKMTHLKQRPFPSRRQQLNFLAGYEEAVTVSQPPVSEVPERPASDKAGFVISLYQVNPGEDGGRFEQNWVTWTGARHLYSHVPPWMGLKRISIHKSVVPSKVINYVLLCEFSCILDYITDACVLVDQLRARCCGFTGLYRVLDML